MVVVSNNKKKSLQKAKIIINFDLKYEDFSNYQINRNSIVINLSDNIMKMENTFNGVIVNSMQIGDINYKIRNYYLFEYIDLYESYIFEEKNRKKEERYENN